MTARLRRTGEVEVELPASPTQVWAVLADVTRVGEWSHECHTASWLPGHGSAEVGARFTGSNRTRTTRWTRQCTMTDVQPGHLLVYHTSGGVPPDSTEWRFELEARPGGGTRVRQSYRVLELRRVMEVVIWLLVPTHRDRRTALVGDLTRLGEVAAGRSVTT